MDIAIAILISVLFQLVVIGANGGFSGDRELDWHVDLLLLAFVVVGTVVAIKTVLGFCG